MRLLGGPWEMVIRPERGGRIASLLLDGEELLDRGIGVDRREAMGFVESGAFGWDELVPTVEASGGLPDHGEAWRLPWTVDRSTTSSSVMTCSGRLVPWELERKVQLGREAVSVSYVYTNRGVDPHRAFWCAHPLFRYEPGMRIGVVGGERLASLREGTSEKVYLAPGSVDRALLGWRSGTSVEVSWDAALTPYVGAWACNGDLGGYMQVAIEPATGGGDRPDSSEPAPLLDPGESRRWWMKVRDARRPAAWPATDI